MNTSMVNERRKEFSLTTACVAIQLIVFSTTFVLGVVGNILLVVTVYKRPALHKVTYYLVSALAIEDFLTLITYGAFTPQALVLGDWFLGDFACTIYSFLLSLCGYCEFHLLAVISLDRYIACCRPLRYFDVVTPRRCAVAIACCWAFALALAFLMILECEVYGYDDHLKNCLADAPNTPKSRVCVVVSSCLSTLPCTAIISVCQWKILKQARRVTQNNPANVTCGMRDISSGNRPSKATMTVSLMTATFFICWFPFLLVIFSGTVVDWKQSSFLQETHYTLTLITVQIFYVSKFANSIIYGIYNSEFRKECRSLFQKYE